MNPRELTFTVVVTKDKEGGFISRLEEIPFIYGYGTSEESAAESAANSLSAYIIHKAEAFKSRSMLKMKSADLGRPVTNFKSALAPTTTFEFAL